MVIIASLGIYGATVGISTDFRLNTNYHIECIKAGGRMEQRNSFKFCVQSPDIIPLEITSAKIK